MNEQLTPDQKAEHLQNVKELWPVCKEVLNSLKVVISRPVIGVVIDVIIAAGDKFFISNVAVG